MTRDSLWETLVEGIIKASLPPPKAKDDDYSPPPLHGGHVLRIPPEGSDQ